MHYPNRDSDNDAIVRMKNTHPNWLYNQAALTFKTSKFDSAEYKSVDNNDIPGLSFAIYDSEDNEITSAENEANAVKTVLSFEPEYDFDIIGGMLVVLDLPEGYEHSAKIWLTSVPFLTKEQGGSINFIDGRVLCGTMSQIVVDGRGPKTLYYSDVYHTNELELTIKHETGNLIHCEMIFETFYER